MAMPFVVVREARVYPSRLGLGRRPSEWQRAGFRDAQVLRCPRGRHPAPRRSLEEPQLKEVGLHDILDGVVVNFLTVRTPGRE